MATKSTPPSSSNPTKNRARSRPPGRKRAHPPEQLSLPLTGKKEAPRDRGERKATEKPKEYPPVPVGKVLIFRMYFDDPRTGRRIYSKSGRPIPIYVDAPVEGDTSGSK